MKRLSAQCLGVLAGALLSVSGCGQQTDLGKYLRISIEPNQAYVVPGTGNACVDNNDERTILAPRVTYSNFRLQWTSTEDLYVALIRVELSSTVFTDGVQKILIDDEEIEALLGAKGAFIPGIAADAAEDSAKVYNSNATGKAGGFRACGLSIGGLEIPEGTRPFKANAKIEVIGYSVNKTDGTQTPVRQYTTGYVEYLGD